MTTSHDGKERRKKQASTRVSYSVGAPFSEDDEDITLAATADDQNSCQRCCNKLFPAGFGSEFKKMFVITWPICVTQICQMIIGPISLIFCGHLGSDIKLDGAAMAISMINATCISVGQGLGTACDTFFSQSYGSKNKKRVGIYLQRALLIFMLALVVCFSIHINMELILRLLGQHPEVSSLAGSYMLIFIPGAISFFFYIVLAKYIQNQNIVMPNVVIGLFSNAVNAILHYLFLYKLNMGTDGSAIAQSVSYFIMFVLTLGYILISKIYKDTWDGWSYECLREWGQFTRLAIPGMMMVCLEWWGFEIGVFLTGLLGTTELGAQSVLLQIDSIWFQIPLGIQIACSIRVGQYLGSGSALGAITAARLAIFVVFSVSVIIAIVFVAFRYQLPYIFTNVEKIAELTGDLLPIVTIYVFFDGIATACKGVLYGTGRQIIGAAILFVSYYLLALPIGIPLMFLTSLRSAAYWWALAINLLIQAIVLVIMVMRTDWDGQINRAQERAGMLGEEVDEDVYLDEKQPLLGDTRRRSSTETSTTRTPTRRRSRLLSASLTTKEIKVLLEEPEEEPIKEVIFKRVLALLVILAILGVGFAVRYLVKLPEDDSWSGAVGNFTTIATPDVTTISI